MKKNKYFGLALKSWLQKDWLFVLFVILVVPLLALQIDLIIGGFLYWIYALPAALFILCVVGRASEYIHDCKQSLKKNEKE